MRPPDGASIRSSSEQVTTSRNWSATPSRQGLTPWERPGGDGTQALVAKVAAELGLPFACIPSGTRNHFALDLGVDRDDVVGALDALLDGRERVVDLAEVNGRVFVNNVSLGLHAQAVQREGYRDAKLRTILDTAPEVLGSEGHEGVELVWPDESGVDPPRRGCGPGVQQRVPARPSNRFGHPPADGLRGAGDRGAGLCRGRGSRARRGSHD